jgi:hypothetical protein
MISSLTPAVKSFLRNNPFIFQRDNLLYAAVFVDADQPLSSEQIQQVTQEYFHEGLAGLKIYRLPAEGETAWEPAPTELPQNVELCAWPS